MCKKNNIKSKLSILILLPMKLIKILGLHAPTVDPTLIADQRNLTAKYLQNVEEN